MNASRAFKPVKENLHFLCYPRDSKHHHEMARSSSARLQLRPCPVCKPHRETPKTVEYKTSAFASIVAGIDPKESSSSTTGTHPQVAKMLWAQLRLCWIHLRIVMMHWIGEVHVKHQLGYRWLFGVLDAYAQHCIQTRILMSFLNTAIGRANWGEHPFPSIKWW